MEWICLIIAGVGEILGVTGINRVNQKKTIGNFLLLVGGFTMSFLFLSIAMQTISMGTAYAIWTGIGTVGSVLIGMIIYHESKDIWRIIFIGMVIVAAVGLKLIS
ncbi:DMT family transporter [Ornithinibacillus bavariensis]|uniref:DMT family transporter n=1 Tax=Ornithinibacillus bavariensis TaxID=545502 RepID=UPI000EBFC472|nr:QacE family quaternary ammonium compound efflux SMR transporter [Ornithinibacillus sp.]